MNMLQKIKDKILRNEKYTITFFGDSAVSTEWVHPNVRGIIEYVVKMTLELELKDWRTPNWNIRFINAALNGGSTKDFLQYMPSEVTDYKPDLAILIGGDNDLENHEITEDLHRENLKKILEFLVDEVPDVVYASAMYLPKNPTNNERYEKFLKRILDLEVLNELTFVDLFNYFKTVNADRFYTFKLSKEDAIAMHLPEGSVDPFHPNQLGQAYLAKILLKEIFDIEFDPEKYTKTNLQGLKYPEF